MKSTIVIHVFMAQSEIPANVSVMKFDVNTQPF